MATATTSPTAIPISIWQANSVIPPDALGLIYYGFKYNIDNGEATIIDYIGDSSIAEMIVPALLGGAKVVGIGSLKNNDKEHEYYNNTYIFKECGNLESIYLPDTIRIIGNYAFYDLKKLTNITLSKDLDSIGDSAFLDRKSLIGITIPNGVIYVGSYAYSGCDVLTVVKIPDSVVILGERAFSGCEELQRVVLSE
ncbi:hypothetical protein FACS1894184_17170 [Clostridia bacterium]|nr:hypothetical protein FACS1894184_17170 [Clostridia bacterium]